MSGLVEASKSGAALAHGVSLREALRVWTRVALLSFGGPAGQIAVMHRIIVDEKHWVSEERFLHALNYCMLLPGPEATQLATYIGWLMHRTLGGVMAGVLFVTPGIIALMGLSYVYAAYGNVPVITALFFGLKAAVLAIVLEALSRISKRALKNRLMFALTALAFIAIFFLGVPFPIIIIAAALIGFVAQWLNLAEFHNAAAHAPAGTGKAEAVSSLLGEEPPAHAQPSLGRVLPVAATSLALWLAPVIALFAARESADVFTQISVFFSKMAVVTFGRAYAVLAYVAQQAVEIHGWLKPGKMLDGLGMAETTPGPLIMVLLLQPLLAGTFGGLLATWVTFTPCFLWIFAGAPFIENLRGNKGLNAAFSAITAAVVGVILNLAIWFGVHSIFHATMPVRAFPFSFDALVLASVDPWALALAVAAAIAIFRFKAGMIATLAACCAAGIVLHLIGAI